MKPLGTTNAVENVLSASKPAFKTTNSKSKVSARKYGSVAPKVPAPKNKSTSATMQILDFYQAN
ncbi:hypothetical protein QYZ44_07385 [Vibrio parahaemolyticus]|nr:hypothetical protein [Vibrio parahaemolyticus]MDN4709662.1 hypothetical protein [Vibrio parahaemolyticus]